MSPKFLRVKLLCCLGRALSESQAAGNPPGAFQSRACALGPAWHSQNDAAPTCPPVGSRRQLPVLWAVPQNSELGFFFYKFQWLSSKESASLQENVGSITRLGRSPGEGNGSPLQYSCLGNPVESGV